MKKHGYLLSAALILSLALTACSSGSTGGVTMDKSVSVSAPGDNGGLYLSGGETAPMEPQATTAPQAPGSGDRSYDTTNIKRILRASLDLQSTEFDAADAALSALVDEQGGYFERKEVQQGTYYDKSASRYGSYTVRVPQEQFEAFLTAAGGVGHVVTMSRSSQDVGQEYFDTETHLKTLRTQQDRLLALLEKASTMEDIISLENALSDVEYQIEQYSTSLRRYDSLIGYSTIEITLREVLEIAEQPQETASLGGRIANAFSGGLKSFGRSMGNFAVFLAYNFVGVIVFLGIAATAAAVVVRRRRNRRPVVPTPVKNEEEK